MPQDVDEHGRVAVLDVAGAEQDCHAPGSRGPAQLGEAVALPVELGAIPPIELVESLRPVPVPAAELVTRRKLARPQIDRGTLAGDPARPQSVDQYTQAVIRRGRVVHTLLMDVDGGARDGEIEFTQQNCVKDLAPSRQREIDFHVSA